MAKIIPFPRTQPEPEAAPAPAPAEPLAPHLDATPALTRALKVGKVALERDAQGKLGAADVLKALQIAARRGRLAALPSPPPEEDATTREP